MSHQVSQFSYFNFLNETKVTYSTASRVPLIDTCLSGGAICPGGGSNTQRRHNTVLKI